MPGRVRFSQVDVFSTEAFGGNPVAVVHDAEGLDPAWMQASAKWTNLSETTFLLPPTVGQSGHRARPERSGARGPGRR